MKSLFRKHYERERRNNAAIKQRVIPVESVTVEKKSRAELDCVPSTGNENNVSQIGSLNTPNEDVSNALEQVADCRHYQQMQPNKATGSVASSSRTAAEGQLHAEGDGTQSSRSVSECHLSQIQSLTVLNETDDCQKRGSSNVRRYTGDWQQNNVQVINRKTFRRAQFENGNVAHWKSLQDGKELRASNNVGCQRNKNSPPTRGFAVVPKKVRIWDGK
jgi:hypothetical protein